jgi:polyisoprenoid-binding protein YceI
MKAIALESGRARTLTHPITTVGLMLIALGLGLNVQATPAAPPPAAASTNAKAPAAQQLLEARSEIRFVTQQMGVPVEGRFKRFSGQIAFDPRQAQAGRIALVIDMGSATFDIKETDAELSKPEWFHTVKFPQARFEATTISAQGAGRFLVKGRLGIKGVTRELSVPVTLSQSPSPQGLLTVAKGQFPLNRNDYKIGDGDWADPSLVGLDVTVKFSLTLLGVGPL